ncbi:MAG: hypothetical protein LBU95_03150, partial [Rikenellaceae bacterium]|nr:hypothetical protein [Rikenellaceae bacterium]
MRHVEQILCPFCGCDDLRKNGHSPNGTQRWVCKGCHKFFQRTFKNLGRLQETKDKILEMVTNG